MPECGMLCAAQRQCPERGYRTDNRTKHIPPHPFLSLPALPTLVLHRTPRHAISPTRSPRSDSAPGTLQLTTPPPSLTHCYHRLQRPYRAPLITSIRSRTPPPYPTARTYTTTAHPAPSSRSSPQTYRPRDSRIRLRTTDPPPPQPSSATARASLPYTRANCALSRTHYRLRILTTSRESLYTSTLLLRAHRSPHQLTRLPRTHLFTTQTSHHHHAPCPTRELHPDLTLSRTTNYPPATNPSARPLKHLTRSRTSPPAPLCASTVHTHLSRFPSARRVISGARVRTHFARDPTRTQLSPRLTLHHSLPPADTHTQHPSHIHLSATCASLV